MVEVQRIAMRMMRSSGFSNVTVEQIAEAADVSPPTVYRYFGTKEALVLWAAATFGVLVSVLERWQATGGDKSLGKQITKAHDKLFL
jgi:AcrR family transcriptional regulator